MVLMSTVVEIRRDFVEWNGWGPPTSEYQIGEYCRAQTESEQDSDYAFKVLTEWMHESQA